MSQDISGQVTEGILNAIGYLVVGSFAVFLFLELWWVIILLVVSSVILGLLGWGFWVFAKNHKTLILWVSVAVVLIVGLIVLVANNFIQF